MDPLNLVGSSSSPRISVSGSTKPAGIARVSGLSAAVIAVTLLLVGCSSSHPPPPAAQAPAPTTPPPAPVESAPALPADTLSTEEARDLAALQAETFKAPVGSTNADLDDELERFLKEESDALLTETVDYDIPIVINERVEYFVDYFQRRVPKSFAKWLAREPQVAPYMRARFREEGLPEDLIYISLIESGFSAQSTSRARAVGYWQFIAGTARRYGLQVDRWVDERRDIETSTEAAIAYLKDLHRMFGSWYLAAAAYNSGEGRIQKAIDKYGSENLWELAEFSYLRNETKDYVPKLIAATLIAKEPGKYGFGDIRDLPPVAVDTVLVPTQTDLRVIAAAAGTDVETIRALNAKLRSYATPPGVTDFAVIVPRGSGSVFVDQLARVPAAERLVEHYHVVKRGETPSRIAARYGVTTVDLMAENEIRNPRALRVGQRLRVPLAEAGDEVEPAPQLADAGVSIQADAVGARAAVEAEAPEAGGTVRYRVRRGDNLYRIALNHGVALEDVKRWNPSVGSRIYPGQTLLIRTPERLLAGAAEEEVAMGSQAPPPGPAGRTSGVSAEAAELAAPERDVIPPEAVVSTPEIAGPAAADEGGGVAEQGVADPTQPTSIEVLSAEPQTKPPRHVVHEVQDGETISTIAALYDVTEEQIRLWNGLRGDAVRAGLRLVLFPGAPAPRQ
jgi:membrane-bound lytic murein transglycosylase D